MLNAHFKPLRQWPGQRVSETECSRFKAGYDNTLAKLEYELGKLEASDIIIQVDGLTPDWIRNDGWPKGQWWNLKRARSGVILSFQSPKGAISFPCDRFEYWQDNLRAIALSLEALRAVDRYGVTRGNEQYRGWAQLEAPSAKTDREGAIQTIASILNAPRDAVAANPAAFIKQARIAYHPDGVTDEAVKKQRHEMSVLISKAERALFPDVKQAGS